MTISAPTMQKDCYKEYHLYAYHPDITKVYVNFTSRSGRLSNVPNNEEVLFVGLQYFIKDYLQNEWQRDFFGLEKDEAISNHKRILSAMLGHEIDVSYLERLHDLGYLPLKIKALAEGSLVPYQVPCITIENTVEGFQWLPNMIETVMSCENWPIQTSATTALAYYKNFKKAFEDTGLPLDLLPFMGHDFSFRGLMGRQAAAMSGFGHLCSGFAGTDTIPAVLVAEKYYNANVDEELVGTSVPATEHSVTCSAIIAIEEEVLDLLFGLVSFNNEGEFNDFMIDRPEEGTLFIVNSVVYQIGNIQEFIEEYSRDGYSQQDFTFDGIDDLMHACGIVSYYSSNFSSDELDMMLSLKNEDIKLTAECIYYYRLMTNITPTGILSLVADSYDFWSVVTKILPTLKDNIMARDGKIVIRPDSGDPVKILTGMVEDLEYRRTRDGTPYDIEHWEGSVFKGEAVYDYENKNPLKPLVLIKDAAAPLEECEVKGLIECLWDTFGGTLTDKGYKVLDEHIGAIYGDSITLERQQQIFSRLKAKGFAPTVVLGLGSYSYQYVTRDSHSSAVKATNVFKDGKDIPVFKDPKTDRKKKSAKGLLRVEREDGKLVYYDEQTREQEEQGLLGTVFLDGELVRETSLAEIRELVSSQV